MFNKARINCRRRRKNSWFTIPQLLCIKQGNSPTQPHFRTACHVTEVCTDVSMYSYCQEEDIICGSPFVSHQPVHWISQSALRLAKKSTGLRFPSGVNIYTHLQRWNVFTIHWDAKVLPQAKGHWPEAENSRLMLPWIRELLSGVSYLALRAQELLLPVLVCCRAHSNQGLFSGRYIK
jgi:hypothetical protein